MNNKRFSVYGIGNPLMDLIAYKDQDFISGIGVQPGTMNLVNTEEINILYDKLMEKAVKFEQVPGGSCANTLRGISWLSKQDPANTPVYSGAVGKDDRGQEYIALMTRAGINALISTKAVETGYSIIIVTPDYERTMFTYLGACREFEESGINFDVLADSAILHITGYMWDTENQKKAVRRAIRFARDNRVKVSFDLADPFVVNRNRDDFLSWIGDSVDLLFGNTEEFRILTGNNSGTEQVVKEAGRITDCAIIKAGAEGCYINKGGSVLFSPGKKVKAADTVGAGDSFAAGFLYGLLKDRDIQSTADLANTVAANIVTVEGCNFGKLDYKNVFAV